MMSFFLKFNDFILNVFWLFLNLTSLTLHYNYFNLEMVLFISFYYCFIIASALTNDNKYKQNFSFKKMLLLSVEININYD